jgi:hypothetical protein
MLRRISNRLLLVHVIAERQLREIALVESDDHAAQKAADDKSAVALIRREIVALALRVVEFLLPRLYVDVSIGQLAEINLRTGHAQTRTVLWTGMLLKISVGSPSAVNPLTGFMVMP